MFNGFFYSLQFIVSITVLFLQKTSLQNEAGTVYFAINFLMIFGEAYTFYLSSTF